MRFHLYQYIFVFLTISLIFGIVLSDAIQLTASGLMIVAALVTVCMALLQILSNRNIFVYLLFFIFLGIILETERKDESILPADEQTVLLKVDDFSEGSGVWNKGIGEVTGVLINSELIRTKENILFYSNYHELQPGEQLVARIKLIPIENKGNPGEFDAVSYWRSKRVRLMAFITEDQFRKVDYERPGYFANLTQTTRAYLTDIIASQLPNRVQGIASAILLGDKSALSNETRSSFGNAGAMHLLAVSGLHVGIILMILIGFFKLFPKIFSTQRAYLISLLVIWFYAGITGFSPSVIRASFMFSMLVISGMVPGSYRPLNVLFFTAFCTIIIDPLIIYDIGFQLSYAAMLGIFLVYEPLEKTVYIRNKYLLKLWQATCVGIAAQVFTVPLTLYYFHQFPNYFVITNLGIMVLAGAIMFIGLLLFIFGKVPYLSGIIVFLLGSILMALLTFIVWIDDLPGSIAEGFTLESYHLIVLYASAILFTSAIIWRPRLVPYSLLFAIFILTEIEYERYTAMERNEIVFFNAPSPLIAVKIGHDITLIKSEDIAKRDELLIKNYERIAPGRISKVNLKQGTVNIEGNNFPVTLDISDKQWRIVTCKDTLLLIKGYGTINRSANEIRIGMAYLKGEFDHSLKSGAFRYSLEK